LTKEQKMIDGIESPMGFREKGIGDFAGGALFKQAQIGTVQCLEKADAQIH
jgi:hypothetical protein